MLTYRSRIRLLPDKGERIRSLYDRILKELVNRDKVNKASELFSVMNIAAKGKAAITNMEWLGKLGAPDDEEEVIGNDDPDEKDPLKLLAQSRHPTKIVKAEPEVDASLITAADLEEIASFKIEKNSDDVSAEPLEPHALYMCDIEKRHATETHREKFLPHKTTTSNVHSVAREKQRRPEGKHWEVTAATPPRLRNAEVVSLTLQDSIDNQRRQIDIVKV